jgi:hypothetical protein
MKSQIMAYAIALSAIVTVPATALADAAPTIGGGATLNVSIGKAGLINAGAAIEGTANIKQSVGSVVKGTISGRLKDTVTIGEAGVVNIGAAIEGMATVCQSVGSIGSDCGSSKL